MLKAGLSHGVAVIPEGPKERYIDPVTGAHFKFDEICIKIEVMEKKREIKYGLEGTKSLNKDFYIKTERKEKKMSNHEVLRPYLETEPSNHILETVEQIETKDKRGNIGKDQEIKVINDSSSQPDEAKMKPINASEKNGAH